MADFVMPSLGAAMEAGKLVEWRVKPGDAVRRGDVIAVVETDKGAIDVEVFASGAVDRLLVDPGTTVAVGAALAVITSDEAEAPARSAAPAPAPAPPTAPSPSGAAAPARAAGPPRASPMARRRARELGLDLGLLVGTGPSGAITAADVEAAKAPLAAPAPAPASMPSAAPDARGRMRRAVASAMTLSKREIPHFYAASTFDLGPSLARLAAANQARPVAERILPAALLLRAVVVALRAVPEMNARWSGAEAPPLPAIHLGVAVAIRGGGLMAPAIMDAGRLDVPGLMAALTDVVGRARAGHLRSSELSEGTLTVTSLGERGADEVFPVIFPPQVAMVGVGRIVDRPWIVEDRVVVRPTVRVSVAADHRVLDGHAASRFLAAMDAWLTKAEEP